MALSTLRSRLLWRKGTSGFLPLARQSFSGEREEWVKSLPCLMVRRGSPGWRHMKGKGQRTLQKKGRGRGELSKCTDHEIEAGC